MDKEVFFVVTLVDGSKHTGISCSVPETDMDKLREMLSNFTSLSYFRMNVADEAGGSVSTYFNPKHIMSIAMVM